MAKKKSYDAYLRQQIGELIDQLHLSQFDKQSLKERWLDQMIWADKKAAESRRSYNRLRLTTVIGGVILPALVGISVQLGQDNPFFRVWFPPLTFALSQIIAVSVAIEEFCKFGDRWRDYRKMAEDLKSEGWQYLQSSGPYEVRGIHDLSLAHEQGFAQFANRVESIIRNDVQSYISDLMQQQAKHDAETQRILEQAKSVINDQTSMMPLDPSPPLPGAPDLRVQFNSSASDPTSTSGYRVPPSYQSLSEDLNLVGTVSMAENGQPSQTDASASGYPPTSDSQWTPDEQFLPDEPSIAEDSQPAQPTPFEAIAPLLTAPAAVDPPLVPPIAPHPFPPPTPLTSPSHPASSALQPVPLPSPLADLNAAIVDAALKLRGMSTADGPDGGVNACAWSVDKVLREAGIPSLGDNPRYVPDVLQALKAGRGQQVSPQESKAGDLVVAYGEEHIGISLEDGCKTVLSNSSSRACFSWESDVDYGNEYGGSSTVYRLLW